MQFELLTPMEQAAMIAAAALMVFAITHTCDRLFAWSLTLKDRQSRRRHQDSMSCCAPDGSNRRGKG